MTKTRFSMFLCLAVLALPITLRAAQNSWTLTSPNRKIMLAIRASDRIRYDLVVNGKTLLQDSTLSLNLDQQVLGLSPKVKSTKEHSVDQVLEPVVRQKLAKIREHYNELRLDCDGNYAVIFRAYDEGAAYRFETSLPAEHVKVYNEEVAFNFTANDRVFFPEEESFFSHNERRYLQRELVQLPTSSIASMPVVVIADDGTKIAIAESDVEEYPGMWLRGANGASLTGTFPHYPLKGALIRDRDSRVTETADYIADTKGTRTFPWRILGVAEKDGDLITNQLVWLLAKPSQLQDTSWIQPGKVAWDWWNANNIYGVDFKSGINTQTYKYYIDFAAKYGLQYVILDEGWYKLGDVLQVVPDINMEELCAYAKQRNVGLILWAVWKTLDDQMIPALDQYQKWGIKGIKVDFMQRDDQKLIEFYFRLCSEAAKRHLLVDLHGGQKQATMTRTWPNLISAEGVRGNEWSKWSTEADPAHTITLPFTRMFLGPMDYTPGAMRNATKANFSPIFDRPMSLGTRCNQLAMYVVFESPLQMLSDSPSNYLREPEIMEFLGPVPTVWDDTKVLDAVIGEYIVVARRHRQEWYVGAMTNWTPRTLEANLSFLPEGTFWMDAYQDGVNADRDASDYKKLHVQVTRNSKVQLPLAPGGGWAARIHP